MKTVVRAAYQGSSRSFWTTLQKMQISIQDVLLAPLVHKPLVHIVHFISLLNSYSFLIRNLVPSSFRFFNCPPAFLPLKPWRTGGLRAPLQPTARCYYYQSLHPGSQQSRSEPPALEQVVNDGLYLKRGLNTIHCRDPFGPHRLTPTVDLQLIKEWRQTTSWNFFSLAKE